MSTPATGLARVSRIDFDERSASFFRFARELGKEGRPRGISNAFGKTMVVGHPVDLQVFDAENPVGIDDLATFLVGEVFSTPSSTFMHSRNRFTVFAPNVRSDSKFRVLALHFCQCFFFLAKEARIGYLSAIRKGCKRLESYINTYLLLAFWQTFRITLYRKADVPLACRAAMNGTGFELALDWAMKHHLDTADLGEADAVVMGDGKPALREREAIITSFPFKTREPWVFSMFFDSSEKGFEGQVNAHCHILQDLGMHLIQRGPFLLQDRN